MFWLTGSYIYISRKQRSELLLTRPLASCGSRHCSVKVVTGRGHTMRHSSESLSSRRIPPALYLFTLAVTHPRTTGFSACTGTAMSGPDRPDDIQCIICVNLFLNIQLHSFVLYLYHVTSTPTTQL